MKKNLYIIVKTTKENEKVLYTDTLYNFRTKTEATKRLAEIKNRCVHEITKDTKIQFECNYRGKLTTLNFEVKKV